VRNVTHRYDGAADPDAVDQLVDVTTGEVRARFSYDPSGNMTVRDVGPSRWRMLYDDDDRMRLSKGPGGTEYYYYDHEANRTLRIDPSGDVHFTFGGVELVYDKYGAVQPCEQRAYISAGAQPVAEVKGRDTCERLRVDYHGGRGDMLVSLDDTGNLRARFEYGPFGEATHGVFADAADTVRRFNNKQYDKHTGLHYYGYRYYDPAALAWTRSDPMLRFEPDLAYDQPRRMGLYVFSLNNPVRFVDPDGRAAGEATLVGCAVGGPAGCGVGALIDGLELAGGVLVGTTATAIAGAQAPANGSTRGPDDKMTSLNFDAFKPKVYKFRKLKLRKNKPAPRPRQTTVKTAGRERPMMKEGEQQSGDARGGAPGTRPGKPFTKAGKDEVWKQNAAKNGGKPKCENCGTDVVKPKKHEKGVRPPGNEGHVDHRQAKSKDGSGTTENGDLLCRDCNLTKGAQ